MKILDSFHQITETAKGATDHIAAGGMGVGLVLTNVNSILSAIALLMTIAWYGYRFYSAWQDKRAGKKPNLNE